MLYLMRWNLLVKLKLRRVIDMTIDEIKRQMFIDSEEVCGNTMIDIPSRRIC